MRIVSEQEKRERKAKARKNRSIQRLEASGLSPEAARKMVSDATAIREWNRLIKLLREKRLRSLLGKASPELKALISAVIEKG